MGTGLVKANQTETGPLGAFFFASKLVYTNYERSIYMDDSTLERRLADHCAPTLLGAKAANLLSLSDREFPDLALELRQYNRALCRTGLRFMILRRMGGRSLVLVYRPAMLRSRLNLPAAKALLARFSYPQTDCLGALLKHLKSRFGAGAQFPHEIGLFLDYPAADVEAFIAGAAECKLCGYWKVYCDVDAAREKFACYDACRQCVLQTLAAGSTISQLLRAA